MRRLSPPAWAILERLSRRPMSFDEWHTLDQRFLRSLYLGYLFYFDAHRYARITTDGQEMIRQGIRKRKDPTRPVFTEKLPRIATRRAS